METTEEQPAIEQLIFSYQDAFNAADISSTVASYASDGTLMANNAPTVKGQQQITASFEFLLKAAEINVQYVIDEIMVNGEHAYARTHSTVQTVVKANGERISLENKEIFLFRKRNGEWKISHYIFNNTKTNK